MKELTLQAVPDRFVAQSSVNDGDLLDDVVIKLSNGNVVKLKKLLKDLGEL